MAKAEMRYRMVRRQHLDAYHHKYHAKGQVGDPCTYCGVVSDSMDHVPPLHYVARLAEIGEEPESDPVLVPACRECNGALGGALVFTMTARRKHVKDRLRKKYRAQLRMPGWDADDLDGMTPEMVREILANLRLREHVMQRLAWMK